MAHEGPSWRNATEMTKKDMPVQALSLDGTIKQPKALSGGRQGQKGAFPDVYCCGVKPYLGIYECLVKEHATNYSLSWETQASHAHI